VSLSGKVNPEGHFPVAAGKSGIVKYIPDYSRRRDRAERVRVVNPPFTANFKLSLRILWSISPSIVERSRAPTSKRAYEATVKQSRTEHGGN
jgi:hypothetical protein